MKAHYDRRTGSLHERIGSRHHGYHVAEHVSRTTRELRTHAPTAHWRAHWHHLRTELKRATLAYAQALAQAGGHAVDEAAVAACRIAAETEMPGAMASSDELRGLPGSASNVLGATVHADLWRLSHLEMQIRQGGAAPGDPTKRARQRRVTKAAERAQRQIRQALFAYVEVSVRGTDEARAISKARVAAADQLKGRCPATLRRLRTDWAVRAAS